MPTTASRPSGRASVNAKPDRVLTIRGRPLLLALGLCAALGVWLAAAGAYYVFHDQLLASLIARQSEMQYSYEDQIAGLSAQVAREAERGTVARQLVEATLRDLDLRSARLEARAQTLDDAIADRPVVMSDQRTRPALGLDAAGPLRLGRVDAVAPSSDALSDPLSAEAVGNRLDGIERRQTDIERRYRQSAIDSVERLHGAIDRTGPGTNARGGVGGPFVPLSSAEANALPFDEDVALLHQAAAERSRLRGIAGHLPLRRPLREAIEVTSPFGVRLDPFYGSAAVHTGVDLKEETGGPVMATAAGVVTIAGPDSGYGNMVELDHGGGLRTRYAHLSVVAVTVGEKVAAGAIVGRAGSSGRATGPHLHYETRVAGLPTDPMAFLRAGALLRPDDLQP